MNFGRLEIEDFETSEEGNRFARIPLFQESEKRVQVCLNLTEKHLQITGRGGSFKEASAYLRNQFSKEKSWELVEKLFKRWIYLPMNDLS
ncbi:MAG: hypothetical protein LAT80_01075 [Balneolaceae bacterium]|nr:hypothetical protein [Balneolaceae bacterium]